MIVARVVHLGPVPTQPERVILDDEDLQWVRADGSRWPFSSSTSPGSKTPSDTEEEQLNNLGFHHRLPVAWLSPDGRRDPRLNVF
jgi:hypothetical protein